jgi:putative peptide zinc metalloprotease protein
MVESDFPKIRQDLILGPCLEDESKCIVKDPVTSRYYKMSRSMVKIMQSIDGTQSTNQVAFRCGIEPKVISQILADLDSKFLLENGNQKSELFQLRRKPFRRNPFFIQIGAIDPYPIASKIYDIWGLKLLFSWFGAFTIFTLYISAFLIGYHNQTSLWKTLDSLISLRGILLGWGIYMFTGLLHELGHVWGCKRFGGRASSLGFGLYFLSLCFYVDISDAWLFNRKSQRIIAHAAGVLTDFFLASLAMFAFCLFNIPTIREIAALIVVINTFQTVNNFNPLLRLDGYFLLSDWLGINNLRAKGFRLVFICVRGIAYRLKLTSAPPIQIRLDNRRELIITVIYGILSLSYLTLMNVFLARRLNNFLSPIIGPLGASIIAGGFGLVVYTIFLNIIWRQSTSSRTRLIEY